jgi:hypothetical protein
MVDVSAAVGKLLQPTLIRVKISNLKAILESEVMRIVILHSNGAQCATSVLFEFNPRYIPKTASK